MYARVTLPKVCVPSCLQWYSLVHKTLCFVAHPDLRCCVVSESEWEAWNCPLWVFHILRTLRKHQSEKEWWWSAPVKWVLQWWSEQSSVVPHSGIEHPGQQNVTAVVCVLLLACVMGVPARWVRQQRQHRQEIDYTKINHQQVVVVVVVWVCMYASVCVCMVVVRDDCAHVVKFI